MATKSNTVAVRGSYIPSVATVALGRIGHSVDVKTERFSDDVITHVFNYGLKQMLNDAAASGKTDDEKVGLFTKKLEAMYEGTLRAARESDPIAAEARRIATDFVKRKTDHKAGSDAFKAAVAKAMADEKVRALAAQNVERAKALDFDISF